MHNLNIKVEILICCLNAFATQACGSCYSIQFMNVNYSDHSVFMTRRNLHDADHSKGFSKRLPVNRIYVTWSVISKKYQNIPVSCLRIILQETCSLVSDIFLFQKNSVINLDSLGLPELFP